MSVALSVVFFFLSLPFPAQSTTCNWVSIVILNIINDLPKRLRVIRIRCFPSSDTSDRRRSVLCVPTCLAHIIVVNYNIVAVRSICYRVSGGQVDTELTATPHERNARRGDRLINTGTSSSI